MKKSKSKPSISKRKNPKQERSRGLVDSVMEATTRILVSWGYDKVTTNRVAELAGVSVGSLYQYFPNKDAIFAALIDKVMSEFRQRLEKEFATHKNVSIDVFIERVVLMLVDMFLERKEFLRGLFSQAPRLGKTRDMFSGRKQVQDVLKDIFAERIEELQVNDLDHSSFVLVHGMMGVVQAMIAVELTDTDIEALKRELVLLAKRYLLKKVT